MNKISDQIKSGARAFLVTEYKYLMAFVVVVFAVLLILYSIDPPSGDKTDGIRYGGCFLAGALLSASGKSRNMEVFCRVTTILRVVSSNTIVVWSLEMFYSCPAILIVY